MSEAVAGGFGRFSPSEFGKGLAAEVSISAIRGECGD